MALRIADKVMFTESLAKRTETNDIHLVRRVYKEDDAVEYAIACYCAVFTEDVDIVKVDNERELTCPDCIEQLEHM